MVVEITLVILAWTILSIGWFVKFMGQYQRTDKWYDYILSPPVLIIAHLIGAIARLIHAVKRR